MAVMELPSYKDQSPVYGITTFSQLVTNVKVVLCSGLSGMGNYDGGYSPRNTGKNRCYTSPGLIRPCKRSAVSRDTAFMR